jgi:hypothetical protein
MGLECKAFATMHKGLVPSIREKERGRERERRNRGKNSEYVNNITCHCTQCLVLDGGFALIHLTLTLLYEVRCLSLFSGCRNRCREAD